MTFTNIVFTHGALDDAGRDFLLSRNLGIKKAEESGFVSRNGEIGFCYQNDGKIVGFKLRCIANKSFRWVEQTVDKKSNPLWNKVNFACKDYLIITEGELDALALITLGFENVVSLPNGAGSAKKTITDNADYIVEFKEIYVCFDQDEAGKKAALEVQQVIAMNKYRNIRLPAKDANEWLIEFEPSKEDFEKLMRNAERCSLPHVKDMMDVFLEMPSEMPKGLSTGWKNLDDLIGGIRKQEVNVVTANTGVGKTTFCVNLAYNLAMQGARCWMNSYEMYEISIARKLLSLIVGKNMKTGHVDDITRTMGIQWLKDKKFILHDDSCEISSVKEMNKIFEKVNMVHNIDYVFFDHLDYLFCDDHSRDLNEDSKQVMIHLKKLAKHYNVGIILVAHPRKMGPQQQELEIKDIKGSISIPQYADNVIILTRIKGDAGVEDYTKISVQKNRLTGRQGTGKLYYDYDSDRFFDQPFTNFMSEFEKISI